VRQGAILLVIWGFVLALIMLPMPTIFHEDPTSPLLLGGSGAVCALAGAAVFLFRRRAPEEDPDPERRVTDVSMASALAGVAVALVALGVQFGIWLVIIGAGLFAFAVGGIVRERLAERRLR
jgi:hypothetical protein